MPVPKPGQQLDLLHGRPITLFNVAYRVLAAILHGRLSCWCEKHKVVEVEQVGFLPHRNTLQQVFVLTEAVKLRRPARTFACFVDFTKAYDSVWRNGLWLALEAEGISGKFLQMLKAIYKSTPLFLRLDRKLDGPFELSFGVRQGCLLSPLLFDI